LTVKTPFEYEALPTALTDPTSLEDHGEGRTPLEGAATVLNDHVSDVPISEGLTGVALVRETTFQ
jgi:hypothetical protein